VFPEAAYVMNPHDESEIRAIISLHREIEEKKKEISKRLAVIRDGERATGNNDVLMFVVDGEIWQMKRWAELEQRVTPLSFDEWCLQYYLTRSSGVAGVQELQNGTLFSALWG
jgi:hypothetical protein